jgi:hypothetical protein
LGKGSASSIACLVRQSKPASVLYMVSENIEQRHLTAGQVAFNVAQILATS